MKSRTAARRQWRSRAGTPSPSAPPSAGRGRRELSRRCLSPQGEFRRDPPDADGAREPAKPAVRQGALLYPPFLSPQERWSPAGARPGQSSSIGGKRQIEQQKTRPLPPAFAGATNQSLPAKLSIESARGPNQAQDFKRKIRPQTLPRALEQAAQLFSQIVRNSGPFWPRDSQLPPSPSTAGLIVQPVCRPYAATIRSKCVPRIEMRCARSMFSCDSGTCASSASLASGKDSSMP